MPTGSRIRSAPAGFSPKSAQKESTKKPMYLKKNNTARGTVKPRASAGREPGFFSSRRPVKKATAVRKSMRKQKRQSHQP